MEVHHWKVLDVHDQIMHLIVWMRGAVVLLWEWGNGSPRHSNSGSAVARNLKFSTRLMIMTGTIY